MKALKFIAMAVVGLLAVLLLGGLLLSSKFQVSRTVQIAASPDKVYALVASPRQWKLWSVWNQRDPDMQIDYSGPESGAGAVWAWKSKTEGDGTMSFTAAETGQRVAYSLYFPDFGTTSHGELRLRASSNGGTELTWSMDGDMGKNPLFRWLALFADRMVGPDFEGGLARLKQVAEAR